MNPPHMIDGPDPRNYRRGPRRAKKIDLVVIHVMQNQEKPGVARNVAAWIAGPKAPMASFHFALDDRDIVRCVPEENEAWHAPGVNPRSLGIELAGRSEQSPEQWMDPYSRALLANAAALTAYLCWRYQIPPLYRQATALKLGMSGITTHAEVSRAFRLSTHWDPGPGFPLEGFLSQVEKILHSAGQ